MNIQSLGHQTPESLEGLQQIKSNQPVHSNNPLFGMTSPLKEKLEVRFGLSNRIEVQSKFLETLFKEGVLVAGAAGTMGNNIAMNAMNYGVPVMAQDMTAKKDLILSKMVHSYATALGKGVMTEKEIAEYQAKLTQRLGDIKDDGDNYPTNPAIIVEAIPEKLEWKTGLFKALDERMGPDTILATNTSSLNIDDIAAATGRPDKVIGIHYFLPANQNRLMEIIPGKDTSNSTLHKTLAFAKAVGKTPIVVKNSPGFMVNRIGVPLITEGVRLYDEMKTGDAKQDKHLASAIDQVAMELLWPNFSKKNFSKLKANVLLPLGTLNRPEYMGLIGEIAQVLDKGLSHKYGESYKASSTVTQQMEHFNNVNRSVRDRLGSEATEEAINKAVAEELTPYHIPISMDPVAIDPKLYSKIEKNLLGAVLGVAGQVLDEGISNPADIERGTKAGFGWEVGPLEIMNNMGMKKANALIQAYSKARPGFKASETIAEQAKIGPLPLNFVETRLDDKVQYITVNKPQRNNAMDAEIVASLRSHFRAAENDPNIETIVIESIGGKNFVSGADLPWLLQEVDNANSKFPDKKAMMRKLDNLDNIIPFNLPYGHAYLEQLGLSVIKASEFIKNTLAYKTKIEPFLLDGHALMDEIARSKKVVVAKVNGNALGGGLELALAADYIVAGENANMGLPEVKYGIFPAWGGTERLADRIGVNLAKWMVLAGGLMDKKGKADAILNGKDAFTIGLVDKVVPDLELDAAVQEALEKGEFANKPQRNARDAYNRDLSNTRFAEPQVTYTFAPLGKLLDGDLSGYYDKIADKAIQQEMRETYARVLKLASTRVEKNLKTHPAKDLQMMVGNMAKVKGLEIKAYKAAKAEKANA